MHLVAAALAPTRQKAQALIRAGQVRVNDILVDKPGTRVPKDAKIHVKGSLTYVSRGGLKLEAGLKAFAIKPAGRIAADLGASTGGFTDCLLQNGASKVFAVDVGYGQLAWSLRQDDRVIVMERTNARHLERLPERPSLVVADLSFISCTKILPAVRRIATPDAECLFLLKPQFEAGKDKVSKGGVIRDEQVRNDTIEAVLALCETAGFTVLGHFPSPIPGRKKGNIEEVVHMRIGTLPSGSSI